MDTLRTLAVPALAAAAVLLIGVLGLLAVRRGRRKPSRAPRREALDTVAGWPPEPARVMTRSERQVYDLLVRALPRFMVLAQVPLSRFVRVPTRNAYTEWFQRVGSLSADLLICDPSSRVVAVVDIRAPEETERSRKRHERLARVLEAAGVRVFTWQEGSLPGLVQVRETIGAELARRSLPPQSQPRPTDSRPAPLIPVAEIEEILVEGDLLARPLTEPVSSAFFDDPPAALAHRR